MTKFEEMFYNEGCMSAIHALSSAAVSWSGASRDAYLHNAIVDTMVTVIVCKCHVLDYISNSDVATNDEYIEQYADTLDIIEALRFYEETTNHAHRVIDCLDDNDEPRTDFDWS